jgi:hypothetical protein
MRLLMMKYISGGNNEGKPCKLTLDCTNNYSKLMGFGTWHYLAGTRHYSDDNWPRMERLILRSKMTFRSF